MMHDDHSHDEIGISFGGGGGYKCVSPKLSQYYSSSLIVHRIHSLALCEQSTHCQVVTGFINGHPHSTG